MFTIFKTLDSVSEKAADFLRKVGVPNVTIEKFSQKQEGAEEIESRIIAVDDLQVWEIYKQGGKIQQRGVKINAGNNPDAYAYFIPKRAQRLLAMFVQENQAALNGFMFFVF